MDRFLPKIYLDYISFGAGILLAALFLFLFLRYRKQIVELSIRSVDFFRSIQGKISSFSDFDYNQILYKYAQSRHVSSSLFPLDSVIIPSKCIPPPPEIKPGEDILDPSLLQQTLGYDPFLPELSAEYSSPTFTLLDAISHHANIVLVGQPGTGKTVAIADCITSILRDKSKYPEINNKIPFWVEAQHLLLQLPRSDILGILLDAIQTNPVFSQIPGFPRFLTSSINSENAILFIDGVDTLLPSNVDRIANFIATLIKQLPHLQIVVAAAPSYLGNLPKTPLKLVSLGTWGPKEKHQFLDKWSKLWEPQGQIQLSDADKTNFINSLLVLSDSYLTPLEFTLKVWAAYAGDLSGPRGTQAIDAFLKRISSSPGNSLNSLDMIALQALLQEKDSFSKRDIQSIFSKLEGLPQLETSEEKTSPAIKDIYIGLEFGILQRSGSDRYFFTSPLMQGYFGARGLARSNEKIIRSLLSLPEWTIKAESIRLLGDFIQVSPFIDTVLSDSSFFKSTLVNACYWAGSPRTPNDDLIPLLKGITKEIQSSPLYLVKLRLLITLVKTGNQTTKDIINHLLKSQEMDTRRAAALAAGYVKELSSINLLIDQLADPFPSSTAACYALGKIASPKSLEAIAGSLLHGNELLRRASAESLAQNRSEGHPSLREGAMMDDLLVRYAVVHGLGIIGEDWAIEILDKMRIDEKEWIVRDLAQHVYGIIHSESPYIPKPHTPLHMATWLRSFAEKHNLAMLSPETALELLLKALEVGSEEEKQAALPYLRQIGGVEIAPALLQLLDRFPPLVQHNTALTAWLLVPPEYAYSAPEDIRSS